MCAVVEFLQVAVLVLSTQVCIISCASLPSNFQTCRKSDNNFKGCILSSVQGAFAELMDGNKDLGIPPLDPMVVNGMAAERNSGPISISQKYGQISYTGLKDATISKVSIDFDTCNMAFEAFTPHIQADCSYEYKGQLLVFPIDTKGHLTSKLKDVNASGSLKWETFKKDNAEYIRIVDTSFIIDPTSAHYYFENLIPGNALLNREVHKAINDDPIAFYEIVRTTVNIIFANALKDVANVLFTAVPMKDIFKD